MNKQQIQKWGKGKGKDGMIRTLNTKDMDRKKMKFFKYTSAHAVRW